jgi:hypothetical protein
VTLMPGEDWSPARLLATLAERLPRYALPVAILPLPDSARSGLKPDLRRLTALAADHAR